MRVHRVQRVRPASGRLVQRGRFLGLTGLTAGGFLSLTGPLAPRVADCRSAAMLMKSALRDWLFCVIGHDWHSADWLAALANRVEIIHPSHTTVRTVRYTAVL